MPFVAERRETDLLGGGLDDEGPPDAQGAKRVVDEDVGEGDEVDTCHGDRGTQKLHLPLRHRGRLT